MYIQQIYTNCLAHAAYYIESEKEAMVIDPMRNPEPYLKLAQERGATIRYVGETHFHADFVSGHIDLANATGATIVFGPGATPGYKAYIAEDGEMLHIGKLKIEILHTPGHTLESICFLLYTEQGDKYAVFTGDTLFAGDVGRPDLLSGNLQKEELAAMLFDSLHKHIITLPDETIVYPGHGAGSACGKNISNKSSTTIAEEKKANYALIINDKNEFISAVTSDLPIPPAYFFKDAFINKNGYVAYEDVLKNNVNALSVKEFKNVMLQGVTVLDTRNPMDFAAGFIEGAINIGLNGDFAVWVGTLISADAQLLLVTEVGKEIEAVERLARIGFERVAGYLQGGMTSWFAANMQFDKMLTFSGNECAALIDTEEYQLLDVRNRREVAKNRVAGSVHIPLSLLTSQYTLLHLNAKWLIYCAGGYRSMVAASFLKSKGYRFVASVEGGMKELLVHAPHIIAEEMEVGD